MASKSHQYMNHYHTLFLETSIQTRYKGCKRRYKYVGRPLSLLFFTGNRVQVCKLKLRPKWSTNPIVITGIFPHLPLDFSWCQPLKKNSCVRNHPFKTLANFYGFWPLLPPLRNCLHSSGHTRNSWHLTAPKNNLGALILVSSVIFLRCQKLGICHMYLV